MRETLEREGLEDHPIRLRESWSFDLAKEDHE